MKRNARTLGIGAVLIGAAIMLAGCGGGGGGESNTPAGTAAAAKVPLTLSGTAASGAPLVGATVTIFDATGAVVGQAVAQADGSYSLTLPLTAVPPFVLQAAGSNQSETLFSIFPGLSSGTSNLTPLSNLVGATANITSLTNLLAALLSPTGDPSKLAAAVTKDPGLVTPARVAAVEKEVLAAIRPLSSALDVTTDPLTGTFTANGTGEDRLLDSLLITINPSGSTSNIQISVRQMDAAGTQPVSVAFTSSATTIPVIAAVTPANLVPEGLSQQVNAWIAQLNACYAVPVASRVSDGGNSDSVITAPECLAVFYGNNPAVYLNNGSTIGPQGSFSGIFYANVSVVFFNGVYQTTLANGDYVVTLEDKYTTPAGNTNYQVFDQVLRSSGTSLQSIGNQYAYSGGVEAWMGFREYLNEPSSSFYRSGYNLEVNNQTDTNGNPIFAQVIATSPTGTQFTLVPQASLTYLTILFPSGNPSGSSVITIARGYIDPSNTGDPALINTTSPYVPAPSPTLDLSAVDQAVEQSPDLGEWRFDYYLASAPTTIAATQYYYHFKRNLSVPELRSVVFADLTPATQAAFISASVPVFGSTYVPVPASGPLALSWEVPSGAALVTEIEDFGRYAASPAPQFNDTLGVTTSTLTASISCQSHTNLDLHCAGGNFSSGDYFSQIQLTGFDPFLRDFVTQNNFTTP